MVEQTALDLSFNEDTDLAAEVERYRITMAAYEVTVDKLRERVKELESEISELKKQSRG